MQHIDSLHSVMPPKKKQPEGKGTKKTDETKKHEEDMERWYSLRWIGTVRSYRFVEQLDNDSDSDNDAVVINKEEARTTNEPKSTQE